jgi:glycosyltransferase involved in cell wall biosynthesis
MNNPICETCPSRVGRLCTSASPAKGLNLIRSCPEGKWGDESGVRIAPFRDASIGGVERCQGAKVWEGKQVSVIIPVLEYNKTLDLVLEGIRRQTVPSVIYIVDTGSVKTTAQIAALRDKQTEVIQLRMQGWWHTSMPVAAALDAAWQCINTPYCFFTHDDCFLMKQTCFSELIALCKKHYVVGHQITERADPLWHLSFGHTLLMTEVRQMDLMGVSWNMRRFETLTGVSTDPRKCHGGYPDTESLMNHIFRLNNFIPSFTPEEGKPLFIGTEQNWKRNVDEWMDHCRSMTCAIYDDNYAAENAKWVKSAMEAAVERYKSWT